MPMDLSIFISYRINLVRQCDLAHFPGFVSGCEGSEIEIRRGESSPNVGDIIAAAIIIHYPSASFVAVVREVRESSFILEVTTPINLEATEQSARRELSLLDSIQVNSKTVDVEVTDIAMEGIGLHCKVPLEAGSRIEIHIPARGGSTPVPFEVKYCLPQADSKEYKVGCQIDTTDPHTLTDYTLFLQSTDPIFNRNHKKSA